jgi:broad specificity phosphatase PhoE
LKARETAAILAARLNLTSGEDADLNEHRRDNVPYLSRLDFEARIQRLFAEPDALVFGQETAAQAYMRFAGAVERALAGRPDGDVALVTHGTVMTLYAERHAGVEPFVFWQALRMPDLLALAVSSTWRHMARLPGWGLRLHFCTSIWGVEAGDERASADESGRGPRHGGARRSGGE